MKKILFVILSVVVIFSVLAVSCFAVQNQTYIDFNYQINLHYALRRNYGFYTDNVYTTALPSSLYVNIADNFEYQYTNYELLSDEGDYWHLYDKMTVSSKEQNAYYYVNYGLTCDFMGGYELADKNVIDFRRVELQDVFYHFDNVPVPYIVLINDDDGSLSSMDLSGRGVKYTFSTIELVPSGVDGGFTYVNNQHVVVQELTDYKIPLVPSNLASDYGVGGVAQVYDLTIQLVESSSDTARLYTPTVQTISVAYPSNRLVLSRQAELASAFETRLLNVNGNFDFSLDDFSLTDFITNSIQPILDIQFAPWLTLGDCIFVFIAFALFIIFLKVFAGGKLCTHLQKILLSSSLLSLGVLLIAPTLSLTHSIPLLET